MAQRPAPQQAQPPQPPVVMPSAKQIVLLTRSALMTLGDAMRTGNYTVLHDVGSPSFQKANPPAKLAQIFSSLIKRRVDLSLVAITVPNMNEALLDEKSRLLRLTGTFPTLPRQINFVLLFQEVSGVWRLFGISVDANPTAGAPGQPTGAAPANVAAGAGRRPPSPPNNPTGSAAGAAPASSAASAGSANSPPLPKRNPGVRGWSTGATPANADAGALPLTQEPPAAAPPATTRRSSGRANSARRDSEEWGQ